MKSELEQIPGIGANMASHLINAGYPTIASLKGQDLEEIYLKNCAYQQHRSELMICGQPRPTKTVQ